MSAQPFGDLSTWSETKSVAEPVLANVGRSRAAPRPMARTVGGKAARKFKTKNRGRKFLSGVTLQDAADAVGAVVRWGGKALALLPNIEEKFFDVVAFSSTTITTTPTIANLSNIAQGNDWNNRNGNSIRLRHIRWDFMLYPNATAVLNSVRIIVFRDMMQRGTDPAAAELLESTTAVVNLVSPYLHYDYDRFQVLYDDVVSTGVGTVPCHKRMILGVDDHVLYQNTTGADASNWQGACYALAVGEQGTNGPQLTAYARLSFTDD